MPFANPVHIVPESIESNRNHTTLFIPLTNTLLTQNVSLMAKNKLFVACWKYSSYAMKKKQLMQTYVLTEKLIYSISAMLKRAKSLQLLFWGHFSEALLVSSHQCSWEQILISAHHLREAKHKYNTHSALQCNSGWSIGSGPLIRFDVSKRGKLNRTLNIVRKEMSDKQLHQM